MKSKIQIIYYYFYVKIDFCFEYLMNSRLEGIIQNINFLKNENCIFCIFLKKFEKRISFKSIFRKLNVGKLLKINFICCFYLPIFSSY